MTASRQRPIRRRAGPAIAAAVLLTGAIVPVVDAAAPAAGKPATDKAADSGAAKPALPPVSYHRDLRIIVQRNCVGCHQPARRLGRLLMTSYDDLAKGGAGGKPWVAGKPAESPLIWYLRGTNDKQLMPQGGPALPAAQIALFERWIAEGATDDTPESFKQTLVEKGPPTYFAPVAVTAMAWSPDGGTLAVAGYREVLLHDASGKGAPRRLVGLSERIETVVFSPDGSTLAVAGGSAGRFGELQLWDWQAGKLRRSILPSYDTIYGASWSPDGKRLSFGCADNSIRVVDAATGKQTARIDQHQDWVLGTALSLDEKHVVSAGRDRAVKLCESTTGSFIDNITTITPGLLGGGLRCLQRRPGKEEYLTAGEDGVPALYQMLRTSARRIGDDANRLRSFEKLAGKVECAAFSADGRLLAAGGNGAGGSQSGQAKIYSVDDGKKIAEINLDTGAVFAVAIAKDNKTVALAGLDGMVRLYSLPDGKLQRQFVPVPLSAGPGAPTPKTASR